MKDVFLRVAIKNSFRSAFELTRCEWICFLFFSPFFFSCNQQTDQIDYSLQVKPIINRNCISCHGGVKRQANFSLLFRKDALDTTESGKPSIIPGDAAHSEMIKRLTSTDPEERMPYKENALSKNEIEILRKWIEQGAKWGDHWAYVPPRAATTPVGKGVFAGFFGGNSSKQTIIDDFIDEKLKAENLSRSKPAERSALVRRVYFDVVGLPPSPEQASLFIENENEDAYEKLVNNLLASPKFGEKWASWWLDLARYSDTKGYERDAGREIWRYRDYVIKAFNEDKPFDQFTIEQLAGDLLPNPTDDQYVATAFHRNTMNNDEGGTEDEEFRVASTLDRLNTTFQVWQSTTFACVQCHSHPYDPFRHEEYYKALAFFNNSRDEDTYGEHPVLKMYEEKDQKKLDDIIAWVKKENPIAEKKTLLFLKTLEPKIHPHDFDQFVNGELIDTKFLGIRHGGSARLTNVDLTNKSVLIMNHQTPEKGGIVEIRADNMNGTLVSRFEVPSNGWKWKASFVPIPNMKGVHSLYFKFINPKLKEGYPVTAVEWIAFREELPGKGRAGYQGVVTDFDSLVNRTTEGTPIMIENTERVRTTHVFERGNWLVKGALVKPEVPRLLNPFPEGQPTNRLGFAKWLVDKNNPLTARTIVNRVWEQLIGIGLVETSEDFGTQGAKPSHPELLDWLSLRLMNEHKWSIKKLIKDIVMTQTYQQDSKVSAELLEKDPLNKLLARGPRIRLSAEQVRDQALAVSGLLSDKMYGKSIMPYQPDGVWQSVWSDDKWETSKGDDQYRRGVYIYSKRTSPYPSMMTFDGSSREICTINRIRTNTPLQALVTLNDPVYVDAARAFASKMMKSSADPAAQIAFGYESVLFKSISEKKLSILSSLYSDALANYKKNPAEAKKLIKEEKPELAALTIVASAILNLDELITN